MTGVEMLESCFPGSSWEDASAMTPCHRCATYVIVTDFFDDIPPHISGDDHIPASVGVHVVWHLNAEGWHPDV
jgi:hypothetical protein